AVQKRLVRNGSWFRAELDLQLTIQPQQTREIENVTTLHSRKLINLSPLRSGFLLIMVALGCFAVSPAPKAFGVSPPPDGGYRDKNTAEGDDALFNLAGGSHNTAIGFEAL